MFSFLWYARVAIVVMLAWLVICVVGAAGSHSDALRLGHESNYGELVYAWIWGSIPLMDYTFTIFVVYAHWPEKLLTGANIAKMYFLSVAVFYPLELLYQAALSLHDQDLAISLQAIMHTLTRMPKSGWFLDFVITSTTFAAVVAIRSWTLSREREQALHNAMTHNLELKLALEQQRLQALRAQLEPHFMFNALNAISALVRSDDKRVALSAITRLSELLRYALKASQQDWVTVEQEIRFVEDYLSLQKLRYGERLQLTIVGVNDHIKACDCLPLLLQPLVENALRHELDCHAGVSTINLDFSFANSRLAITLSNSRFAKRSGNPGLGVGLKNTVARLRSMYGEQAQLNTQDLPDRFVVTITQPCYRPE